MSHEALIRDLGLRPAVPVEKTIENPGGYDWQEFAFLWDGNDMARAHDWLNLRWSRLIRDRIAGEQDPEAQFLQGLAFATLALHFTQSANQEGALLVLDDALVLLSKYRPAFLGVEVDPVIATLNELRPLIAGLAPDAECPMQPFVYRKFRYRPVLYARSAAARHQT